MRTPINVTEAVYQRLLAKVQIDEATGCWVFHGKRYREGYGMVSVDKRWCRAHRVSFHFHNKDENPLVVRHLCHNPPCVNPAHLAGGTQKDNARDRMEAGRGGYLKGAHNGRAVLTEADVLFIRSSPENGAALARRFGVTRTAICSIRRRKAWTHI